MVNKSPLVCVCVSVVFLEIPYLQPACKQAAFSEAGMSEPVVVYTLYACGVEVIL